MSLARVLDFLVWNYVFIFSYLTGVLTALFVSTAGLFLTTERATSRDFGVPSARRTGVDSTRIRRFLALAAVGRM